MFKYFVLSVMVIFSVSYSKNQVVNIIGHVDFNDGIGRVGLSIADALSDCTLTIIPTNQPRFSQETKYLNKFCSEQLNRVPGINIFASFMSIKTLKNIKNNINIAYSMIEGTAIPKTWTEVLNRYFDMVVVPDMNVIPAYVNSGVTIPVYAVPIPLYLESFLAIEPKVTRGPKFVFGVSAGFGFGKNQRLLVEAFHKAFGNDQAVVLKLHGRHSFGDELSQARQYIASHRITNIEIIEKIFSEEEYLHFMSGLDCYILLSKGEGFSITPREALAMGIPCILSYVGAHKTICDTNLVRPVTFGIPVISPFYIAMFNDTCGYQFNCVVDDATEAIKDVYTNYAHYKRLALQGRSWVQQYLRSNMKTIYMNLVKPKKIMYGKNNRLTESMLETNSKKLYMKYKNLMRGH